MTETCLEKATESDGKRLSASVICIKQKHDISHDRRVEDVQRSQDEACDRHMTSV